MQSARALFRSLRRRVLAACVLWAAWGGLLSTSVLGKACVWKVSDGQHTLYLAGSVHALRASDYPLPPEYQLAFDNSAALAFETDLTVSGRQWSDALDKASELPRGVTLKDRVDPRTYAYMERVMTKFYGSSDAMKRLDHLRPWYIADMLDSPQGSLPGLAQRYGVEPYLVNKAKKAHKQMAGLVSFHDHIAVMGKMSDQNGEAALLLAFIQLDKRNEDFSRTVAAWKRGDIDAVGQSFHQSYGDAPGLEQWMVGDRNRRWLPRIEGYLRSGKTWMVVAGAAHMAGDQGLPALLRAQGFQVEQL